MYLVVIGVLSIILAFTRPPYALTESAVTTSWAVALATAIPSLVGLHFNRRALRAIERHPADPGHGHHVLSVGLMVLQLLLALLHAGVLLTTSWMTLCRRAPVVGEWPGVAGLLAALPFLLAIALVWLAVYPADRALRQIAVETSLYRGRPVHPTWSLGQYVVFNLRHQVLFVMAPMLLILVTRDLIDRYDEGLMRLHPFMPDMVLGLATAVVALVTPALLRYVWSTTRLADGPLRDRLLFLCRKLRMRCREILVWRSGGMIVNAAVMGVVAPLRYVMITDGMLEQLDDTKIEAVFGHEAGHVKRHHILYFLLLAFISGCWITVLSVHARQLDPFTFQVLVACVAGLLLLKWGVIFGWISRRFERQADVFGVRTLALSGLPCRLPCAVHMPEPHADAAAQEAAGLPARDLVDGDRLCATAAHVFGDTLNDVAVLNGIPPETRSWRHSSIASRSRFVRRLAQEPPAVRRFERTVLNIKRGILAGALLSGGWAAWELQLWTVLSAN
ncbi:MAG TPA: M48 family metallopeptidase [Phycisphaerae bacterium]|nr:M48 family metallopeptidase [Phycisphaerae bacterium]